MDAPIWLEELVAETLVLKLTEKGAGSLDPAKPDPKSNPILV